MERRELSTFLFLFIFNLAIAQEAPPFNDWSARGVEQQATVLYRDIDVARNDLNDIAAASASTQDGAMAIYLSAQKQIYKDTRSRLNNASSLATEAGYPKCAAKAKADVSPIVVEYQAQLQADVGTFTTAVGALRASVEVAKASLNAYSLEAEITTLRACNSASNNQSTDDCYKKVLEDIKKKLQTVNTTLQSIKTESEAANKAFSELQTKNNRTLAQAESVTGIAVADTLKCANLDKKSPVQVTLDQIAKLNATTSDYISTNTDLLETFVNSLKSDLNLTQRIIGNNLQAGVQPFLAVGKYLTLLDLSADKEEVIRNQINTEVQNTITNINELVSEQLNKMDKLIESVRGIQEKYALALSYVSKENLTNICVPKDPAEQAAKEEEIKNCLANLFSKFSTSAQDAKIAINEQLPKYNALEKEILATIENDISTKINNSLDRIEKDMVSSLISYGYDPENILQIIEQHFSLLKYKEILNNQSKIRNNVIVVQRSVESILKNLDYEIDSALSRLSQTIEVIKILNPNYNTNALKDEITKIKIVLKINITSFVNKTYNDTKTFAELALAYNYHSELDKLLTNATICLPVNLLKLISCFEPKTTEYNKTLIKAIRLADTTLSDTNYITQILPRVLKEFVESLFNKTKVEARLTSIDALTKANPGIDSRRDAIIKFQDENDKRIKEGAQGPIESTYQSSTSLTLSNDRIRLGLEDVFRSLRLLSEKRYSEVPAQPLALSGKVSPCQLLKNIDQYINYEVQNRITIASTIYNYTKVFTDIKNNTSNLLFDYVKELKESNCTMFITAKQPYDDCIQNINKRYEAYISGAAEDIESASEVNTPVFLLDGLFNQNYLIRVVTIAGSKIDKQFQILEQQIQELLKIPTFFNESLKTAQEEYQQSVIYKNNIKTFFNLSHITHLNSQFQVVLNTSAYPINITLSLTGQVDNVTPSPELQNLVKNSGTNLVLLLQNASSCYRENVTSAVQVAFEKANNNIQSLRIKILTNNIRGQNKIDNYVSFIEGQGDKFTENAVKSNCKTVSVLMFIKCVQFYLDSLVSKLRSEKLRIEGVVDKFSNVTIGADLTNFEQQIKAELSIVDAKLQSEIDKVKSVFGVWKSNEEIVQRGFVSLNDSMAAFLPVIDNLNTVLTEEISQIRNGSSSFRENITALLTRQYPATEEVNTIINQSSVLVYNNTQFSIRYINIGYNFIFSYRDLIRVTLSSFNRTIEARCFRESRATDTFNACVQATVDQYKSVRDRIITEVNTTKDYNKKFSECAKTEIATVMSNELRKAEAYLASNGGA